MSEHPSPEDISLYVYGKLSDPSLIERHIGKCADCAAEIMLGREIRYMDSLGLMPLDTIEPTPSQSQEPPIKPANEHPSPGNGIGGAILEGLGLAGLLDWLNNPSPAPALGEQDHSGVDPDYSSSPLGPEARVPQDDSTQFEHPENPGNSAVTHNNDIASHSPEAHSFSSRELDDFINNARPFLDGRETRANEHETYGHADGHSWQNSHDEIHDENSPFAVPGNTESDDCSGERHDSTDIEEHAHADDQSDLQHTDDHHGDFDQHINDQDDADDFQSMEE